MTLKEWYVDEWPIAWRIGLLQIGVGFLLGFVFGIQVFIHFI